MKPDSGTQRSNRYYLMRHGESLANRRGLIVSQPENALLDYGLTSKGAEQVMESAMHTRLDRDTIIVSSDYKRARETAEIMQSVIDCEMPITFDERLRERDFGDWELQDHQHYHTIWQHDLNNPAIRNDNVESVESVLQRASAVIDDLEKVYSARSILLIGHGDVLQILLAQHHNINPRFHRSLSCMRNADIRSLAKLELAQRASAV